MDEAAARAIRRRRSVIDVKLEAASNAEFLGALKTLKRAGIGGIEEDWGNTVRPFPVFKDTTEEESCREFLPLKPGWWERFLHDEADPEVLMAEIRKRMKKKDVALILEDDERLLLEFNASLPGSIKTTFRFAVTNMRYMRLSSEETSVLESKDLRLVLSVDLDSSFARILNITEKKEYTMIENQSPGGHSDSEDNEAEGGKSIVTTASKFFNVLRRKKPKSLAVSPDLQITDAINLDAAKPSGITARKIHRVGWVLKKGGLKGGRRNWKRKYCVLKEEVISFWASEEDVSDSPHSILNLNDYVQLVTRTHKANGFALRDENGVDFHLIVEEDSEFVPWCTDLKTILHRQQIVRDEENALREMAKQRRMRMSAADVEATPIDVKKEDVPLETVEETSSALPDLDPRTQAVVLKEGYVYKKSGRGGGLVHTWTKKFCAVVDGQIFVYKSHTDFRPKARIHLSGCELIENTHKMYGLAIRTQGAKDFQIALETAADWREWIEAINTGIAVQSRVVERQNNEVKKGYLWKKGGSRGSGRRAWKIRYIIIQQGFLNSYKTERHTEPSTSFCLSLCQLQRETHKTLGFCLKSEGHPDFHLMAETEAQYNEWIAAVEKGIQSRAYNQFRRRTCAVGPALDAAHFASAYALDQKDRSAVRIVRKQIQVADEVQRDVSVLLMRDTLIRKWQALFEQTIILAPEIYQCHLRTVKINSRTQYRDRWLAVSNTTVYNAEVLEGQDIIVKACWGIAIQSFVSIALDFSDERLFAVELNLSLSRVKPAPSDTTYGFKCDSSMERALFVSDIARLYYNITGQKLRIRHRVPEIFEALVLGGDVQKAFKKAEDTCTAHHDHDHSSLVLRALSSHFGAKQKSVSSPTTREMTGTKISIGNSKRRGSVVDSLKEVFRRVSNGGASPDKKSRDENDEEMTPLSPPPANISSVSSSSDDEFLPPPALPPPPIHDLNGEDEKVRLIPETAASGNDGASSDSGDSDDDDPPPPPPPPS